MQNKYKMSGIVCVSHPKHTIYAFIRLKYLWYICHVKRTKIKPKRPGLAHLKTKLLGTQR